MAAKTRRANIVVPLEPTDQMILAAVEVLHSIGGSSRLARACYAAFIATRPRNQIKRTRAKK